MRSASTSKGKRRPLRQLVTDAAFFTLWGALFFPGLAHAYVDPGSGSVIVTAVLGAIGAIGYTFRKYFYRLRSAFSSRQSDKHDG